MPNNQPVKWASLKDNYKAMSQQDTNRHFFNSCLVDIGDWFLRMRVGVNELHILIFSKYKYLHANIASLANVKSCVTIEPIH